jgi:hypothetical protein
MVTLRQKRFECRHILVDTNDTLLLVLLVGAHLTSCYSSTEAIEYYSN